MNPIRIVIADDHEIFRNGFKLLLKKQKDIVLVGEAGDGHQLLELVAQQSPDVVITDIQMPVMNGIEACRHIRHNHKGISVIALTSFNDDHFVIDMLEAGASGYILKNTDKKEVANAVKAVFEGHMYYSDATSKKLARLVAEHKVVPGRTKAPIQFTERELLIMRLICQQLTSKEIAAQLQLSARTVESHREKIQEKTYAKNTAGIVIYVMKHNLFEI